MFLEIAELEAQYQQRCSRKAYEKSTVASKKKAKRIYGTKDSIKRITLRVGHQDRLITFSKKEIIYLSSPGVT